MFFKLLFYVIFRYKLIVVNNASGLGDYLWGRYYFDILKQQYRNHKLVLIGTKRWIDFAKYNDSDIFDVFIPIGSPDNVKKIKEKIVLKLLFADIFINLANWDSLIKCIKRRQEYNCIFHLDKFYDENMKLFYEKFINVPQNHKFRFKFTSKIKENDYILLALGGYAQGSFSKQQLMDIIDYLLKNTSNKIFLLGNGKDKILFDYVYKHTTDKSRLINGVKAYKSYDIPAIINNSLFVITPNTSIYHFAKMLDKPCVCVSAGEIHSIDIGSNNKKFLYVVDDKLELMIQNNSWKTYKNDNPSLRICDFESSKIINKIQKMLIMMETNKYE